MMSEPSPGGRWPKDDLRRAFVTGAAWWEYESRGATMWASDRDKAEAEAERRFPVDDSPVQPDGAEDDPDAV